ncbi:MAG: DUF1643 domain-containing protein [Eudoraea sp.]|nr:DUF1643 domain-containing protein [Eudoraea sp.]
MVFQHIDHINATAQFSHCASFRYRLTLEHSKRKKGSTVCVIMQNPSVAGNEVADKSVHFLEKLIFEKKYPYFKDVNRVIIVNQFARVQTKDFVGSEEQIGPNNEKYLYDAIKEADIVLIAWGKSNPYIDRQKSIVRSIRNFPEKELLMTKKHPSRGTYKDFILPYTP